MKNVFDRFINQQPGREQGKNVSELEDMQQKLSKLKCKGKNENNRTVYSSTMEHLLKV